MSIETFSDIYLDLSRESGKCRFAESGFGWKPSGGGDTFTCEGGSIASAQWSRASRGYEIKILQRDSNIVQLDGFQQEDYERLSKYFKTRYSVTLEQREHSIRGWNWGKSEFGKAEFTFNVQNRPAFELPYSEISNTNLAGRNEVVVEMHLPTDGDDTGTNGHLGGARAKGKKAGAGSDQLVEMRFYVPGTAPKKHDAESGASDAEDEPEQNAANLFYDTMRDKAEIGKDAGDQIASFSEVLHLTPRQRFDIDMYTQSFRLRGKTYDYKIQYEAIKKFMVLPKPDDMHMLLCLGLDPPLRQGQTRYPFIVMQFKRDEEISIELNLKESDLQGQYKDRLAASYEEPQHQVVAKIFKGLANKKITAPAKDFLTQSGQTGIKCFIKASEGFLYLLERAFMFVPKPAMYISYDTTHSITLSRVSGAVATLSTFDITIVPKAGGQGAQFTNISRDDLKPLEEFFRLKGLRVKNEIDEEMKMVQLALRAEADADSSGDEGGRANRGADRGSADEDEESVDEDFQADSESEVAEEFDSEHDSGSGSDDESGVNEDDDDDDMDVDDDEDEEEEEERPKKKKKTN